MQKQDTLIDVLARVAKAFRAYAELPKDSEPTREHNLWLELCWAIDAADGGGQMSDGEGYFEARCPSCPAIKRTHRRPKLGAKCMAWVPR